MRSSKAIGDRRRISTKPALSNENNFFSEFQSQLHSALVVSSSDERSTDRSLLIDLYSSTRLSAFSAESREAIFRKLPDDVRTVQDRSSLRVDILEADLIEFLLNYSDNRVLSVVGPVGIGKSTFLRYVLYAIRDECESMAHLVPIIVDCLGLPTDKPSNRELLRKALRAVAQGFARIDSSPPTALMDHWQERMQGEVVPSTFLDFFSDVKQSLLPDREPVVVFDNVDQLDPRAVSKIIDISRGIFLETNCATILSMRPNTYRTHLELSHERGAFLRYLIEVTPPDLCEIVRLRLEVAFRNSSKRGTAGRQSKQFIIDNVPDVINSLSKRILTPDIQAMLLEGIANNNVRFALKAFERFLRHRDLNIERVLPTLFPLATNSESWDETHWKEHILNGMMHGSDPYYHDDKDAVIANIFVFEPINDAPKYLILHRILATLDWAGEIVDFHAFSMWMTEFGYDPTVCRLAVTHLLRKGLVYSPETEVDAEHAQHLSMSPSGYFYLHFLLQYPQYLYNAIYDVPLSHENWRGSDNFSTRLHSIYELLLLLIEEEKNQIERIFTQPKFGLALSILNDRGLLVRSVFSSAMQLLGGGLRSSKPAARDSANEHEDNFRSLVIEIERVEKSLKAALKDSFDFEFTAPSRRKIGLDIGESDRSFIEFPDTLEPLQQNVVFFQVDTNDKRDEPVVVFMEANGTDGRFGDISVLEKSARDNIYRGKMMVQGVKEKQCFPGFSATVFRGSEPVLKLCADNPSDRATGGIR